MAYLCFTVLLPRSSILIMAETKVQRASGKFCFLAGKTATETIVMCFKDLQGRCHERKIGYAFGMVTICLWTNFIQGNCRSPE